MRVLQLIPAGFMDRKYLGIPMKVWFPLAFIVLILGGTLTPLFDLSSIHGIPSIKLYIQHLYWDFTAGLGGYYAATLCKHAWHRWSLMIAIDLFCTLILVTLIG